MTSKPEKVKRLYWMRIPVADYLEDTAHLTTTEWYAYTKLVMHYWRRGGLPSSDKQLSQILGLTVEEWDTVKPALLEMFGRNWKHPDLDRQLAEAGVLYERKAENARRSAEKRELARRAYAERDAERTHSQSESQSHTLTGDSPYHEIETSVGSTTHDTCARDDGNPFANVVPLKGGAA